MKVFGKKFSIIILLALVIIISFNFSEVGAASYSGDLKVSANLNMRSEAGTDYSTIATIANGSTVTGHETSIIDGTTWYKVTWNDKIGWVSGEHITPVEPTPATSDLPVVTVLSSPLVTKKYMTTVSLNMRDATSPKGKLILTIPKGTYVDRSAWYPSIGWSKIIYKGKEGYVNQDYLTSDFSAPSVPTPSKPVVTPPSVPVNTIPYTTTANLNMRTEMSAKGELILTIPKGATVARSAWYPSIGWSKITYNGKEGYVNQDYLMSPNSKPESTPSEPVVTPPSAPIHTIPYNTTANLNMRTEMSAKGKLILTIPKGQTVARSAWYPSIGWSKITYNGKEGYVNQDYLMSANSKPESTPSEPVVTPPSAPIHTIPYSTTANLNMRTEMSAKGKLILTIPKGQTVARSAWYPSIGWSKITYNGKEGYVNQDYLTSESTTTDNPVVTPPLAPVDTITYMTSVNLNMRDDTSAKSNLILTIPQGSYVERSAWYPSIGWSKITYKGKEGYVNQSYLTSDFSNPGKPAPDIPNIGGVIKPGSSVANRQAVVDAAKSIVGKVPYFWGGKSWSTGWNPEWNTLKKVTAPGSRTTGLYRPYGLDCSGFVDWAYRTGGAGRVFSNGGTAVQWENSTEINQSQLLIGDVAFKKTPYTSGVNHIGIYVGKDSNGNELFAHASSGQNNVVIGDARSGGFQHFRRAKNTF